MSSEIHIPKEVTRFTNNDNPVISLLTIFIAILLVFIYWREKMLNKTMQELSASINMLVGASNAKK